MPTPLTLMKALFKLENNNLQYCTKNIISLIQITYLYTHLLGYPKILALLLSLLIFDILHQATG